MSRLIFSVLLLCFIMEGVIAQEKEIPEFAKFQYGMVPEVGEVSWNEYVLGLSKRVLSFKEQKLGFLVNYGNTSYEFFETAIPWATDSFQEVHLLNVGVYYQNDFAHTWSMGVTFAPVISSTLDESINGEDFQYGGNTFIKKSWRGNDKVAALKLGIGYGTVFGEPNFYPIVSFESSFNTFFFELGFPESTFTYDINSRHDLLLNGKYFGSYANISNVFPIGTDVFSNTKLEYQAIDVGIQHEYRLQPNFTSVLRIGYLLDNSLQLLSEGEQQLYDFNTTESIYFSMGLILNFNN